MLSSFLKSIPIVKLINIINTIYLNCYMHYNIDIFSWSNICLRYLHERRLTYLLRAGARQCDVRGRNALKIKKRFP